MITMGVSKARQHLYALLDHVATGEAVVITRHGKPVARLVDASQASREATNLAIARLKELRRGETLRSLEQESSS